MIVVCLCADVRDIQGYIVFIVSISVHVQQVFSFKNIDDEGTRFTKQYNQN